MAEAADRPRVAALRGGAWAGARLAARAGAAGSLLLALAMGAHLLREAGFRFRWETGAHPDRAAPAPAARPERVPGAGGGATGVARSPAPPTHPTRAAPGPAPSATRAATASPPAGAGPVIGFERLPDGSRACAPCPVSDEFAAAGVRFAFRSWAGGASRPHVVETGEFAAPGETADYAVAPAYREEKGLEVGVIAMEFPDRPARVAFQLTGPDLISRFRVTAWTPDGRIGSSAIPRSARRRFVPEGGGWFRRETVTVESAAGIERIELDGRGPPGHVLLVDDLVVGRVRSGRIDLREVDRRPTGS